MAIVVTPETRIRVRQESSLFSLVGNTPLLRLHRLGNDLNPGVSLYAKAEWFNPSGSVKDRPAVNILRTALEAGLLSPEKRLLDSTSGNMGISYATLGAGLGIRITLAMPSNASSERKRILRSFGVELILTDPTEGSDGALRAARAIAQDNPDKYFYANQYDNPANWQAHYYTTGPEIIQQTAGQVTHFVAGLGTTGTLMGTGRYLREYNPDIHLVAVQPDGPFHGLEGLKHLETAIQPKIFDPHLADQVEMVSTEDAYEMVRHLAREEGLFIGVSAGAAAVAALRVAQNLSEGVVVTLFPDAGYKYLSETFWEEN